MRDYRRLPQLRTHQERSVFLTSDTPAAECGGICRTRRARARRRNVPSHSAQRKYIDAGSSWISSGGNWGCTMNLFRLEDDLALYLPQPRSSPAVTFIESSGTASLEGFDHDQHADRDASYGTPLVVLCKTEPKLQ